MTGGRYQGVYMFRQDRSLFFGNGYSQYTHMFGDGLFWAPWLGLVADYDQRITPTIRKHVVVPAQHVFVAELYFHVTKYDGCVAGSTVVPVWIPELEA